ncbi:hypothetical protein HHK36_018141 [Tetracentron sinense]|uniref:Nonsense-mediated mRNA decay factor SMG8 n=1 Tax=Tetracentron sinense TaxID=13715 RepID=A0A834Z418_TETSI|nr:hypothetical protein HHK36_018141 [Tetracentron sinense]
MVICPTNQNQKPKPRFLSLYWRSEFTSMETPNPSSLRVLTRPSSSSSTSIPSSSASAIPPFPSSISSTNPSDHPHFQSSIPLSRNPSSSSTSTSSSSSSSQSRPLEGVVVVGFIGRSEDDVTQLINRILDSNVFGSGNLDQKFHAESNDFGKDELRDREELKNWFLNRRISYYYEEEKGIVFLQLASTRCPAMEGLSDSSLGYDFVLEEHEFGDLQGMLIMFSVCHVIIFLQEGSRFDTQSLKKFRMLQAAKHALAPFVRSQITPTLTSRASSSSSQPSVPATSSKNSSPGRGGGIMRRHASSISLMSGLGSYTSLFPGQCTPVILFVFIDDFSDAPNPSCSVEESTDASVLNQSSRLTSLPRPSLPMKGSNSVVVLARPVSKSEGGLRKKLLSSLEAQIRFLIKKCRTLAGSEASNAGSRGRGSASSAPLFSLEASRAVALLDRHTNQRGEPLEFAIGLVEDVMNSKATSDSLLLESNSQSACKEDIQPIKEFIYRQSDTLRGRGGLVTNSSSGSAAGVGMVAVAAAAAAASAASGKSFSTPPELPSLENWLSSSQLILHALLSGRRGCVDTSEPSKKPLQRNAAAAQVQGITPGVKDPLEIAISWLESGRGLNMKFSTLWCQRALPAAKEVYQKELPASYPTSLHEAQLEKALRAFHSMVKGPAVQLFTKKLEDECTSIWRSGRQLCDAVSLTGKPCMHQRHNVEIGDSRLGAEYKPHSSGFVFLHACACGRSRRLRDDPFDFETANITFNSFPDCDNLLPALQLPKVSNSRPIQPSSWSLIRVGGARYYEPSKGLLQSGFCSTHKFLLKWTILLEKQKKSNGSQVDTPQKVSVTRPTAEPKAEPSTDVELTKTGATQLFAEVHNRVENQSKHSENISSDDKKIMFGSGLPNLKMRKPFSEVVAGSGAADSGFPPLQQRKQPTVSSEKGIKQRNARDRSEEHNHVTFDYQGSKKSDEISSAQGSLHGIGSNRYSDGDPFLQIEHLNELVSSCTLPEESHIPPSMENSDQKLVEPLNLSKNCGHEKVYRRSNGMATVVVNKVKNSARSKETVANSNQRWEGLTLFSGSGKEQNLSSIGLSTPSKSAKDIEESLQAVTLDDGGCAFTLLNKNLPIYMDCPHCREICYAADQQVTPPLPVVLATCPAVQFKASCLPPSVPDCVQQSQFSLGCRVILPPESFVTLRLPFVYGVQLEDGSLHPLKPSEHQPELTAWITKDTTLQVLSKGSSLDEAFQT